MAIVKYREPSLERMTKRFLRNFLEEDFSLKDFLKEDIPAINLVETENAFEASCELPGLDPKDFDVSIRDNILTIKGEKKESKEEKDKHYHRIERSYGSFSRSIMIPAEVKEDEISAKLKNGVLTITLPKVHPGKSEKAIEIKVE